MRDVLRLEPRSAISSVSRYVVLDEVERSDGRLVRAYDPKLQREVALKEVRPVAAGATRRLVAQARAMAKLSHPNVVAVYDVEELGSGSVVLVMEHMAGQTLRQWLSDRARPWREVLDRFIAAGHGLVAAHEAGLLHGDFEPSNVLVSDAPTGGAVKLTDVGLAEIPDAASTAEDPQLTFCAALWEALNASGTDEGADDDGRRSAHCSASAALDPSIPRPIADAIARGLSPRPDDRWATMQDLLDALAYDPSRRSRRWLLGVGVLAAASVAALSYGAWKDAGTQRCTGAEQQLAGIWDQTRRDEVRAAIIGIERPYAREVWDRTQRELDAYAADWTTMHIEACEATVVRGQQSPRMLDLRMTCLHEAAVDLSATVDTLADADAKVVQRAHELTGGLRPLSRCADTDALTADVEPPLPEQAEAVEMARIELARAGSLLRAGRYEPAQEAVQEAKNALSGVEYAPVRTEVALHEGDVLVRLGEYEGSEAALRQALTLASEYEQWDSMKSAASQLMYVVGYVQRRPQEGLRYRPLVEGLSGRSSEADAWVLNNLAAVLEADGNYEEAAAVHRSALALRTKLQGPDHPRVASTRSNLAGVLYAQGRYEEAEAEFRAALSVRTKALGSSHPQVLSSRNNLAITLYARGQYEDAEAEFRATLALMKAALGPDHPEVATSRNNLANVLRAQGKYAAAEAEHRATLALRVKTLGADHPDVAQSRNNLAVVLRAQGKHDQAEAEYRAALRLLQTALGPDHPDVAMTRDNLANALRAQGKYEEAEAEQRAALSLLETALGSDHPEVAMSRTSLAEALLEQGRADDALALAERAWDRRKRDDTPPERRARTAFVLARILWRTDGPDRDRDRAKKLAQDALESYRSASGAHAEDARHVQRWLQTHR